MTRGRRQGFTLINMTGYPESVLARELEICYAAIALVTDLDAGIDVGTGVRAVDVFADPDAQIGFAYAPTKVTPLGSHWLWAWSLGIPSSSTKKDAAWTFAAWATSKDLGNTVRSRPTFTTKASS